MNKRDKEPQAREPQDAGFDPATETRWQNAIYETCKKTVGPENDHLIDGGGCDSGDALDFSLAEIRQAIGFWIDAADALRQRVAELERECEGIGDKMSQRKFKVQFIVTDNDPVDDIRDFQAISHKIYKEFDEKDSYELSDFVLEEIKK